ncbi:MAG: PIN domain-containing protein [Balneolaceae bacterium]|nr:PIN domain-containing protein [Balneolaceae bacterium]MDR9408928.1 PIN domain-containing protein [Balneolaceae bacterium]
MDDSVVLYLTEEIAQECINIRKQQSIKLPDAIIAATALVYDMKLITRNISDFKNIHTLNVVNPHLL